MYVVGGAWDPRRNTSGVRRPPPDALPNALRAMQQLRRDHPALVQWILDGHPALTEAEHLARFHEPYRRRK